MEVRTYDNRKVPVNEMTHQHLSNWCWYNKIVLGKSDEDIPIFFDELVERFDGELLPYRPKGDFYYEIGFLYANGMINESGEIVYQNHVIGEITGSKAELRNKLSPIDNLIAILTDEGTYIAFDSPEKRSIFISELSKASKNLKEITK